MDWNLFTPKKINTVPETDDEQLFVCISNSMDNVMIMFNYDSSETNNLSFVYSYSRPAVINLSIDAAGRNLIRKQYAIKISKERKREREK